MSVPLLINRDGLSVELAAGTAVDLRIPFTNESDSPVDFSGCCEGSGAPYATFEKPRLGVAGGAQGAFVVRFAPPVAGSYELTMFVEDDGYLVTPPGRLKVALIVGEGTVPGPKPTGPVTRVSDLFLNLVGGDSIPLSARSSIPAGRIAGLQSSTAGAPSARVMERPGRPDMLGLSNDTAIAWSIRTAAGEIRQLLPGKTMPLEMGLQVKFGPHARGVVEDKPPVPPPPPQILYLNLTSGESLTLDSGRSIQEGQVAGAGAVAPTRLFARVVERSGRPGVQGLRNDSALAWTVRLASGAERQLPPGKTMPLKSGDEIRFGGGLMGRVDVAMVTPPAPPPPQSPPQPRDFDKPYPTDGFETVIRNPSRGEVLELDPGGKALVVLDFVNKGTATAKYVLRVKDDRQPTQDFAEAEVLRSLVDLGAARKGQLAFEVKVGPDTQPGTHDMRISYGQEIANRDLEVARLTLRVRPQIAVGLAAATPRVLVGPLNRIPELTLQVSNAGNVETAYRLRAKGTTDTAADALPGEYPDIDERDGWWYLFDKEAENVEKGRSVPAHLRLFRPGIWWWGWWQTSRVKVVAVPVTDVLNGGRQENSADLVATRWRILFAPWYVAVPMLLLFFSVVLGMVGVSGVIVENAIASQEGSPENRLLYVLPAAPERLTIQENLGPNRDRPPVPISAEIKWDAPFLSFQRVESTKPEGVVIQTGYHRAGAVRTLTDYSTQAEEFRVTSLLNIGGVFSKHVVFVPMNTTGKLGFSFASSDGSPIQMRDGSTDQVVDGGKPRRVREITISVDPQKPLYLDLTNESPGRRIDVWVRQLPQTYSQKGGLLSNKPNQVLPADRRGLKITLIPQASSATTDDLWLVTSDSKSSLVHIKINRTGGTP